MGLQGQGLRPIIGGIEAASRKFDMSYSRFTCEGVQGLCTTGCRVAVWGLFGGFPLLTINYRE